MIIPGVQYPHWKAPSSRKACWTGWSLPRCSSPSMVVTGAPTAFATGVTHESTACWPTQTVQAPHWPSPHPYLVPLSPRSPRRTPSRLRVGSTFRTCCSPLTSISIRIFGAPSALIRVSRLACVGIVAEGLRPDLSGIARIVLAILPLPTIPRRLWLRIGDTASKFVRRPSQTGDYEP